MAETVRAQLGADWSQQFQAQTRAGTPPTGYLSSDGIAAKVWAGGAEPALISFAGAWVDAPAAKFTLALTAAQVAAASLEAATYRLQAVATRGAQVAPLLDTSIAFAAAPGSGPAQPVYGTFAAMLSLAPWVGQVQDSAGNEDGFLDLRAAAYQRLNREVEGWYTNWYNRARWYWPATATPPAPPTPAAFRALLAGGALIATDRVAEIATRDAIALVGQEQVARGRDAGDPYTARGAENAAIAAELLAGLVAEVDTNSDGIADLLVSRDAAWPGP